MCSLPSAPRCCACPQISPESCSCSCYGLPLSIVLVLPSVQAPFSGASDLPSRMCSGQGQDALQQSRSWPAGAPGQPRPTRPKAPPSNEAPPHRFRHDDGRLAHAQRGRTPGRPLGIMISPGCGVPAAGRELSTPRPLRTDARLPAEVGRAQRAARERGPGLRFSSAAASAGLGRRRRRRKVSCALGPGCPARRTRPAAPPRPRSRSAYGPRAARRGPALAAAAVLRQRGSRVATRRRARTRAPGDSSSAGLSFPAGLGSRCRAGRPSPHDSSGTRLSAEKGAGLRKGQRCGSPGTARIFSH